MATNWDRLLQSTRPPPDAIRRFIDTISQLAEPAAPPPEKKQQIELSIKGQNPAPFV